MPRELTNASNLTPQAGRFFAKHTAQKSVQLAPLFMRSVNVRFRVIVQLKSECPQRLQLAHLRLPDCQNKLRMQVSLLQHRSVIRTTVSIGNDINSLY